MSNHSAPAGTRRLPSPSWRAVGIACCLAVALAGCGGEKKHPNDLGATVTSTPGAADTPGTGGIPNLPGAGGTADADSVGAHLCALFTTAEMSQVLGTEAADGSVGGPFNTLCQWSIKEGDGYASVQMVTADFWSPPSNAEDYQKLTGIGDEAYTAPGIAGWDAGVLAGNRVVVVSIWDGTDAKGTPDSAITLLQDTLTRLG